MDSKIDIRVNHENYYDVRTGKISKTKKNMLLLFGLWPIKKILKKKFVEREREYPC